MEDLGKKAKVYANGSHGRLTLLFCLNVEDIDRGDHGPLQLENISLTLTVWRISRIQKPNSGKYKVQMNQIYNEKRKMNAQSELDFPGSIKVSKSDIWARQGSPPNPVDSIEVSLGGFSREADIVMKNYLQAIESVDRGSFETEQSDLSSDSSNASVVEEEDLDSDQDDKLRDPSWEPRKPKSKKVG